jgi:hypothetical protein
MEKKTKKRTCKRCPNVTDIQGSSCDKVEKVNHPAHYNKGKIEVIDAIEAWDLNFNCGNVVKYVVRHKHKGTPIEDIEKAIWYLTRYLVQLKEEAHYADSPS